MKYLIVGCGYLGARVAERWRRQGHSVCVLTRSRERACEFTQQGYQAIVGDVTDPQGPGEIPPVDTVLHCVGFDRSSAATKRDVYVRSPANVLDWMEGRFRRFIYVSSTSVYGQSCGELVDETTKAVPVTEGGIICLDAEQSLWSRLNSSQPALEHEATVLRLAGIYGPGRLLRRRESLLAREPVRGNPQAFLNLIHVDDAADAIVDLSAATRSVDTLVVSDGNPITRRTYFETFSELIGAPCPGFEDDFAATSTVRPARGRGKRCSNRKLLRLLGRELTYADFRAGLQDALASDAL